MAEKAIHLGGEATADAIVSAVDTMYSEHTFNEKDFALKHNDAEIAMDSNFAAQSFWKDVRVRFFRKKSAVLGLILVVFIVLLAAFGPGMNEYTYSGQELSQKNFAPRVPGIEQFGILDGSEKVVGILTRYHLLRPRRKQVVLVDHNEASQSVPGLEEAEILAIIDHHRLADIQTGNPIYVRNEPVGSTNTIIAEMYQDRGLMPSAKLAGMMAAAILSDTVMFKSPTCTPRDIRTAERMARIADVSLDELGHEIFSAAVENKSVEEVFFTDYKEFHIAGHSLAVSQLTCVDSPSVLKRKDEFLKLMKKTADEKMFDLVIMMLTDVLLEGTQIIYVGDDDTIRQAFNVIPKDNTVFLPKVMSRKKQIIPMLSVLWG